MLQTHPAAATFPSLKGAAFDILVDDLEARGQRLPIALYDGKIWDGRARYAACRKLGIKPWLVPLRRKEPVQLYIQLNYERSGEPNSPERKAIVDMLMQADSTDNRAAMRARRADWIKTARTEFQQFEREQQEPCAVCEKYIDFVHAHHSFPLSLQFECGVENVIHDYQWLCPVHHKYVHVLLSGYLLGSRDLFFLDGIPDKHAVEWMAIEKCAQRGIDLCCEALGRVPGENKTRRYDPPYSLYLLQYHRHLISP